MRAVPRWSAVLAVFAIAAVACSFTFWRATAPATLVVQVPESELPADGSTSIEVNVRSDTGRSLHDLQANSSDPERAVLESINVRGDSASIRLRAGVLPGPVNVRISAAGFKPQDVTLRTVLDSSDSFGDGTPDFLRLHDAADRQAFRYWFILLAEAQYYRNSLPAEIDDCAALVRFAYRESLSQHDGRWARDMALPPASGGVLRQYQYPHTPLSAALFRVRNGRFLESDLGDGTFSQFADVETLWRYNTHFVGHELARARPGDLLLFRHDGSKMPFHAMIFLGSGAPANNKQPLIVYHTGPTGKSAGKMRLLSVAELLNYPDARWRPIASNPGFLGVYRWNILRGTD